MLLATPLTAETLTLAALGDSLTHGYGVFPGQGFVPQLEAWLRAQGADVVVQNAGVSGDTTAGGLARTDWTLGADVDAMIVNLGGNDMLRGIDPAQVRANLDGILKKADAAGVAVMLVAVQSPRNYGPDYKADFDAVYPDLAAEHGALLYDGFFASVMEGDGIVADLIQPDGIHPNEKGVARIVEAMGPQVLELLDRVE